MAAGPRRSCWRCRQCGRDPDEAMGRLSLGDSAPESIHEEPSDIPCPLVIPPVPRTVNRHVSLNRDPIHPMFPLRWSIRRDGMPKPVRGDGRRVERGSTGVEEGHPKGPPRRPDRRHTRAHPAPHRKWQPRRQRETQRTSAKTPVTKRNPSRRTAGVPRGGEYRSAGGSRPRRKPLVYAPADRTRSRFTVDQAGQRCRVRTPGRQGS